MENWVKVLRAFPPEVPIVDNDVYAKEIKAHISTAKSVLKGSLQDVTSRGEELLAHLEPEVHTASYAIALEAIMVTDSKGLPNRHVLMNQMASFAVAYDTLQIRYVGGSLRYILETILSRRTLFPVNRAVEIASEALLRLDPSAEVMTSLHLPLVATAYNAGHVDPVLPIIEKSQIYFAGGHSHTRPTNLCDVWLPPYAYINPVTELSGRLKSSNVLEYELVRGMLFVTKRKWSNALDAFHNVITHPCTQHGMSVSKIMVDGYKKWVLVSLIHYGKVQPFPAFIHKAVAKSYEALGRPYSNLNSTYKSDDVAKLRAEVQAHSQVWREDRNEGLIRELLASYQKCQIMNLRDIYSCISLREIRERTKSGETGERLKTDDEIEALIRGMLESNMISANLVISDPKKPPHLVFLSGTENFSEAVVCRRLVAAQERIKQLGDIFLEANERLSGHKEYVAYVQREKKRQEKEEESGRDAFDSQVVDEDLMSGFADPATL